MIKASTVGLLSCALGAVVGHATSRFLWPTENTIGATNGVLYQSLGLERQPGDSMVTAADSLSEIDAQLAAYALSSSLDSPSLLEVEIAAIAKTPRSLRRDLALEALLLRYLDLDPVLGTRFARDLRLPRDLVVTMFSAWSTDDLESALGELQSLDDSRLQRDAAIAIVLESGASPDVAEAVASLIDSEDRDAFRADLLVRLARADPAAALDDAFELEDYWLRDQTAKRIATEWVRRDPEDALEQAQALTHAEPRIRHALHVQIWSEWVRTDPDSALAYLTEGAGQEFFSLKYGNLSDAIQELALSRPDELLAAAESQSPYIGHYLRLAVIGIVVDADLPGAIELAAQLPDGSVRKQWLDAIAESLAREDPERAVQWARDDATPASLDNVLSVVAESDLPYAVKIALEQPSSSRSIPNWLSPQNLANIDVAAIRSVAQMLIDATAAQEAAVTRLTASWSQVDAGSALAWVLEGRTDFDREFVAGLASGIAAGDPQLAARAIDTIPPEVRSEWVAEVAAAFARQDPGAAPDWVSQFRYEPDYAALVTSAAEKLMDPFTGQDPAHVAAMLSTTQNPGTNIMRTVAREWMRSDPQAVADWALRFPPGSARDSALGVIVMRNISDGDSIAPRVLNGFASESAVRRAFVDSIPAFQLLAQTQPNVARSIVRDSIEDPAVRVRIEAEIDRAAEAKSTR